MHQPSNTRIGFLFGVLGGALRHWYVSGSLLMVGSGPEHYWLDLCKSALTAGICGGAGVLGKVLVSYSWKKISRWRDRATATA
jgi:hypothetical protein